MRTTGVPRKMHVMRASWIVLTLVAVFAVAGVTLAVGAACTLHALDQPWWICAVGDDARIGA